MRLKKFGIKDAKKILPKRKASSNKSTAGRTLVIAGSEGMFGAAVLASEAAARIGSGYVNLFTKKNAFLTVEHPSFLVVDSAKNKIPFERAASIAIGPGLGKSKQASKWVQQVIKKSPKNVVIDADALNICAAKKAWPLPSTWIATPHEGELARIIGWKDVDIRNDRKAAVQAARDFMGCICILKGNKTLVCTEDSLFEIQSGNPALAKAGTGDVLTGLIAGLLAQGIEASKAACLGVFVHGWLADGWVKEGNDQLSLMPEDLLKRLPKALTLLRR